MFTAVYEYVANLLSVDGVSTTLLFDHECAVRRCHQQQGQSWSMTLALRLGLPRDLGGDEAVDGPETLKLQ